MDRKSLDDMYKERAGMERRMGEIIDFLTKPSPNNLPAVGFHGNLLDAEGYPRDDIDIISIRSFRQELAVLRTDYETLNERMIRFTYKVFEDIKSKSIEEPLSSKRKEEVSFPAEEIKESKQCDIVDDDPLMQAVLRLERENASVQVWRDPNNYFGSIRSVKPESVADRCGLQDGDHLVEFGSIRVNSFLSLKQIEEYYEKSRGSVIVVRVGRHNGKGYETRCIEVQIPADPTERLGIHFVPK